MSAPAAPSPRPPHMRCATGFTLLEILVAFTLMALVVAVLMRVFSGGLQGLGVAEDYARASSIAESAMARVGADIALKEGETAGVTADRYRWSVRVVPHQVPLVEGQAIQPETQMLVQLYEVRASVAWDEYGQVRQVELATLRLGAKA